MLGCASIYWQRSCCSCKPCAMSRRCNCGRPTHWPFYSRWQTSGHAGPQHHLLHDGRPAALGEADVLTEWHPIDDAQLSRAKSRLLLWARHRADAGLKSNAWVYCSSAWMLRCSWVQQQAAAELGSASLGCIGTCACMRVCLAIGPCLSAGCRSKCWCDICMGFMNGPP